MEFPTPHLILMNKVRFISFNCNGAMNKLPVIRDLCDRADIVFLQETWCMPHDIGVFDSVNRDFCSFSTSAIDNGELLSGRPYGGLSVLWRKSLGTRCKIVTFDDTRILGLKLSSEGREMLVLNVYLPYNSAENFDLYLLYVGKIAAILEESMLCDMMILGDFNANVNSSFFAEWNQACEDFHLSFVDVTRLPLTSYTHFNNGSLTRSWVDHCLCTETVRSAVDDISIDYDYFGSDHFPMMVTVKLDLMPETTLDQNTSNTINWDFNSTGKADRFFDLICDNLSLADNALNRCFDPYCKRDDHMSCLDYNWSMFSELVCNVGRQIFGVSRSRPNIVPGWNVHVKEYYERSRTAFFNWREAGSPRSGPIADTIRFTRARFKFELRQCRNNEEQMRSDSLASKLRQGNSLCFWKDIRRRFGESKRKLLQNIEVLVAKLMLRILGS